MAAGVLGTPSANTLSIFIHAWAEISATRGRCPSVRFQLQYQRYATEIWRSFYPPVQNSSTSITTVRIRAYSGNDIFCRLVKKSLLRIVEAESILPERLVTTCVTSSGNAMPSARSTRFSGFKASIPSASSSFSKVWITNNSSQHRNTRKSALASYPAGSSRRLQKTDMCAGYLALWIASRPGRR